MQILGIDIGGSGIKGAPVDVDSGVFLEQRFRVLTPSPATPKAVTATLAEITTHFNWTGPVGAGFPGVVHNGVIHSAANVHKKWIGKDAQALFSAATGCPVTVLNDADAAGLAEMTFGAGKGKNGVVMVITIGTGLGSAIFVDGRLLPNTELGHLEMQGMDAELLASDAARQQEKLSWKKWSVRLNKYLATLERLFSPDLIILGGGVSKTPERFLPLLSLNAQVVPAQLMNDAGIIGAALAVGLAASVPG